MARKQVQIKQIAAAAGVSPSTASIVLNGRGDELRIAKTTQERVRSVAAQFQYTPASVSTAFGNTAERMVFGFFVNFDIINGPNGDHASDIVVHLHLALKEKGIDAEVIYQPFQPGKLREYKDRFENNRYSGIMVNSATDEDIRFLMENDFTLPIIVINRDTGNKYMNIRIDDYEGGKTCARIFAANGHKKAALIGQKDSSLAMRMRQMGFVDGCKEYGIELPEICIKRYEDCVITEDRHYMDEMLSMPYPPTACLVSSIDLSFDVLTACKLYNYEIPNDIEIVAFGPSGAVQYCTPSITSFSVSGKEIAENAVELLLLALKNHALSVSKSCRIQFHFRESCRKPNNF